jgi:transketolase
MIRDPKGLEELARELRRTVVTMASRSQSSHIGSALSYADIVTALYFGFLKVDPGKPDDPGRDRFILSKGHGCMSLYAALAMKGFFPKSELEMFYKDGGRLMGHPSWKCVPGVEATTGSLGHGLPIATGMSIGLKHDRSGARVFVVISDGECDEGSVWEAALAAGHFKLDNLTAIIDYNKIQSFGRTREVLDIEPLADKWRSFGWAVAEIDGHNMGQIVGALEKLPLEKGRPSLIVAHTVKGKGVSFMEDRLEWHYKSPDKSQLDAAIRELGE